MPWRSRADDVHAVEAANLNTAFTFGLAAGSRAEEVSGELDMLTVAAFVWVQHNVELPYTEETIRGLSTDGSVLLCVTYGPSKCDRDAMTWGDRKMWFRYDPSNPLSFAARFRDRQLRHWVMPSKRATTPAFTPDGIRPWKRETLQRRFRERVRISCGEAVAATVVTRREQPGALAWLCCAAPGRTP